LSLPVQRAGRRHSAEGRGRRACVPGHTPGPGRRPSPRHGEGEGGAAPPAHRGKGRDRAAAAPRPPGDAANGGHEPHRELLPWGQRRRWPQASRARARLGKEPAAAVSPAAACSRMRPLLFGLAALAASSAAKRLGQSLAAPLPCCVASPLPRMRVRKSPLFLQPVSSLTRSRMLLGPRRGRHQFDGFGKERETGDTGKNKSKHGMLVIRLSGPLLCG